MKEAMKHDTSRPLTRSQTFPFDRIPLIMKEEILLKLKAKYVSKLISLSKSWSSIVRSKDFTNMYVTQSLTRPRILISIGRRDPRTQFFYSCSQEDPTSDQERVRCNPPNPKKWYHFSPPVRGLISCLNDDNKVMIGNPTTGQFITLPKVKTSRKEILSFFGYDPVGDVYKVLCMTVLRRRKCGGPGDTVSQEHQVCNLGDKKKKWKKIECKHLHYIRPRTEEIYSNGVVYYLAWFNDVQSLISFDVGSEKFSVINFPEDVGILSKYGEKIAITNRLYGGTLDLWVLEDASEQVWSKVSILVPYWANSFRCQTFRFRGTLGTGELIFAPCFIPHQFFLLCYDIKENKARRIDIGGIGDNYFPMEVFLDHVESPMILRL